MKKELTVTAVALAVAGVGFFGISQSFAQDAAESDTIVQKMVARFNLNQADVQKVFDEHRSGKIAKYRAGMEEHLSRLVTEGKLTEEQKKLLSDKMNQMHESKRTQKERFKNLTPVQKREQMDSKRQEFDLWLKQNGIDPSVIGPMDGMKGHKRWSR